MHAQCLNFLKVTMVDRARKAKCCRKLNVLKDVFGHIVPNKATVSRAAARSCRRGRRSATIGNLSCRQLIEDVVGQCFDIGDARANCGFQVG